MSLDYSLFYKHESKKGATDLDNLQPIAKEFLNDIASYMQNNHKFKITVTGGAEKYDKDTGKLYHSPSSEGIGHADGYKLDISKSGLEPNTARGRAFINYVRSIGGSIVDEGNHYDINITGRDSRDKRGGYKGVKVQKPYTPVLNSSMADTFGQARDKGYSLVNTLKQAPIFTTDDPPTEQEVMGGLEAFLKGVENSFKDSSIYSLGRRLWGDIAYTNDVKDPSNYQLTQEDIDYVQQALPNDPAAQHFVLLNGMTPNEIRYLVAQKQEDIKRQQEIDAYNDGAIMTLANLGQLAGGFLDPINYIPIAGGVVKGATVTAKIGNAVYNTSKLSKLARIVQKDYFKAGASFSGIVTADNVAKQNLWGKDMDAKDYGIHAVVAGVAGGVMHKLGGLFAKNKTTLEMNSKLDTIETKVYKHLLDYPETERLRITTETIEKAKAIHDTTFRNKVKSEAYKQLEKQGRVIATTTKQANQLLKEFNIKKLKDNVKAFAVPNENYIVLLTDKIKPKQLDKVISHEIVGHSGLRKLLGNEKYDALLKDIDKQADDPNSLWHLARKSSNSYDPEEILAYAIEHDLIKDQKLIGNLKNIITNTLRNQGLKTTLSKKDIENVLKQELKRNREDIDNPLVHFNKDGTTAFGGIHFSEDNLFNPQNWTRGYADKDEILAETQKGIPKFLRGMTRLMEQGYNGVLYNSVSNSIRKIAPFLVEHGWQHGLGKGVTIPVETHRQMLMQKLYYFKNKYDNERMAWMFKNGYRMKLDQGARVFDSLAIKRYNEIYAGNKTTTLTDVPEEVEKAVQHLYKLRQEQLNLGKNSSKGIGSKNDNLVQDEWYPVDEELWRKVDINQRQAFLSTYNTIEEAREDLTTYISKYVNRDKVKAQLEREIKLENARRLQWNSNPPQKEQKELLDATITDDEVEEYIADTIPDVVTHWLHGEQDVALEQAENVVIGTLSSFKKRLPMDTSGIMTLKNGKEFSFDNNLRAVDLDRIISSEINRFAGEAAIKALWNTDRELQTFLKQAKQELTEARNHGKISSLKDYDALTELIRELRGFRPKNDELSKMGVMARLLGKWSYIKSGANMGFAQLGELGGAIAYGGIAQLFRVFKPLGELMENIRHGKVTAQMLRDVEEYTFGTHIENQIFSHSYNDTVTRAILTSDKLTDKVLVSANDFTHNFAKVVSGVNMLPKMTDSMVRGMRIQTILDTLNFAHGKNIGILRNPFSKKKMEALHIDPKQLEELKDLIKKHTTLDDKGNYTKFNLEKFQKDNPTLYAKWYRLIQNQAERAIIAGTRIGNRNRLKETNWFTRLLFQFKDYNLRAINSQALRVATHREIDDGMAFGLGIATNTAAYLLRAYVMYLGLSQVAPDKAKTYFDNMFNEDNVYRAMAFRSSITAPLNMLNDLGEMSGMNGFTGGSIRTTVNQTYGKPKNMPEHIGRVVAQIPALQNSLGSASDLYKFMDKYGKDEATKKDFQKAMQVFPLSLWIPFSVITNYLSEHSDFKKGK